MSSVDQFIITLNIVGAGAACVVNLWAAISPGPFTMWRPLRAVTALFAAVYVCGYAMLLTGFPVVQWSAFFRGVSVMVWWPVWSGPAAYSMMTWQRAKRAARQIVEATADAH